MSIAHQRFIRYSKSLQEILLTSARKRDKGLFFFQNKGRDILFRLEGLCRLYRDIHNKKFFDGWYKEFKALEDTLGAMDHYEAMHEEFSAYAPFKKLVEKAILGKFNEELGFLNDALQNNQWLSGQKLEDFMDTLNTIDWRDDAEDAGDYAEGILVELQKLEEKYRAGEIDLSLLEEGVHEFRRRLRWVSIYAAASDGIIQLRPVKIYGAEFKKYCTKEVVSSPFNAMPKAPKGATPVYIQSHHFYAMSWLIGHLGDLKDIGLRNEAFTELCDQHGKTDKKLRDRFYASCKYHPEEVTALSEMAIDEFIYRDAALEKIQRDLLRFLVRHEEQN